MRLLEQLRSAWSAPPSLTWFRTRQRLRLAYLRRTRAWKGTAEKLGPPPTRRPNPSLVPMMRPSLTPGALAALECLAARVYSSNFEIFGHRVPSIGHCSFSRDWVHDADWAPKYFRHYSFYSPRERPGDVKFPWELSRLHYLIPVVAREATVDRIDVARLQFVVHVLERWRASNALAHSVNWYPMEASMRCVSLAWLADFTQLVAQLHEPVESVEREILHRSSEIIDTMLYEHAVFVWETRELSEVPGNHWTANLVALVLCALRLRGRCPEWQKWLEFAIAGLDREIERQFCPDGVNFEKACGYHKLVLELFVLAAIARDRAGRPVSDGYRSLLARATAFSDAVMRTDGRAANFGDGDDATAMPFALDRPQSHASVIELTRAHLGQALGSSQPDEIASLTARWVLGRSAPRPSVSDETELMHFAAGGYIIVRNWKRGFHFMMDVGEVGMSGRGGHGHNDILSFELVIGRKPVVVDSGCSGYTLDLDQKSRYRSTASHATIRLFNDELARMTGHWRIANDALPMGVTVERVGAHQVEIMAGHTSYTRIDNRSFVTRSVSICARHQRIVVMDRVSTGTTPGRIEWNFPVGTNRVEVGAEGRLQLLDCGVEVRATTALHVANAPFSVGYGRETTGRVLRTGLDADGHRAVSATFVFEYSP